MSATENRAASPGIDCLKLTSYFGERDRHRGRLLADELHDLYARHAIRNSILLRGAQGFGLHHHLRTDRLLTLSEDLPVVSVALDTRERVEGLLRAVGEIQDRGLLTLERARLADVSRADADADAADAVGANAVAKGRVRERDDEAAKLTVHLGRHERVAGRPVFVAVCELLHREGIAGASALLGVDGTREGRRERARFFAANTRVPMEVIAIGPGERIAALLPKLARLLDEPLLTHERVRICKRDGELLEAPHALPAQDAHGLSLWQKLTVVASEAARHDGRALHLELVRRLRRAGAAGATSLRGIWGFHGAHAPHGDHLLALRRHVPVLTSIVDTPEQIARLFPIVDELTRERGLVTSEIVPAMRALARGEQRGGLRLAEQHRP